MTLNDKTEASVIIAAALLWFGQTSSAAMLVYDGNTGEDGLIVTGVFNPNSKVYHASIENPIIEGKNLYAPDFIRNGNVWNVYYGGWKNPGDGNDRIYFAVSDDLVPEGPWYGQNVIIDNGEYFHVNDPSVQKRGPADWVMAYTVAKFVGEEYRDWIAVSTSTDGANFSPSYGTSTAEVAFTNMTFSDVARPALLWTGSEWKMWFDARLDNEPAVSHYLAVSSEAVPRNFFVLKHYPFSFGEPDIEIIEGRYVAVVNRGFTSVAMLESWDGLNFSEAGTLLTSSDPAFGRSFVSNPGLLFDNVEGRIKGVAYGMTDDPNLTQHDIGFSYPQLVVEVMSLPNVWHVYTQSRHFKEAVQMTFGYDTFCRIVVRNPVTGAVVADKWVSSVAGDRWKLLFKLIQEQ